jgi:Hypoxia induced protein conserved region
MGNVFDILILLAIAAVAITLGMGLYSLYRGGDFARSYSNKLMRLRVLLQAVAVLLLVVGMWWKSTHGA